jgi:hypothetical protein
MEEIFVTIKDLEYVLNYLSVKYQVDSIQDLVFPGTNKKLTIYINFTDLHLSSSNSFNNNNILVNSTRRINSMSFSLLKAIQLIHE